ncbi:MAG: hypothetical protein E7J02_12240 [Staphylococcus warneri]|nr:hypothetical protein [Staphylococcus warneri]
MLNEENIKLDFNAKYEHTEDYLYSLGVPEKKLKTIQNIRIRPYPYERFLFDELGVENNMIIPTSKLFGSNVHGNIGFYWTDLVKWSLEKKPHDQSPNFKPERIRECLSYLKKLGWEKWNQSYQTSDIGELYFSSLEDESGHIIGYMHEGGIDGGRHRIFTAKACGVEYIRAAQVKQFRLNSQKVYHYEKILKIEQNIKDLINTGEIFKKEHTKNIDSRDCWDISIINKDEYYNIDLGSLFVDYNQLKTVKQFKSYHHTLELIYDSLAKILVIAREERAKSLKLKLYPKRLVKKKVDKLLETMNFEAYNEEFLTQEYEIMDYIKWHLFYHYKLLKM